MPKDRGHVVRPVVRINRSASTYSEISDEHAGAVPDS